MTPAIEKAPSIVQIDEHNLDKECIRLPHDFLQYAHLAAEARRDLDEAKAELDVVEAKVARFVRNTPAKYGIAEKVTEGAIKAAVATDRRYLEQQKKVNEAKHQLDMLQAVVSALETKKRSLTLLCDLMGMSYYSNPKVSEAGKEAVERMTQERVRRPARRNED